MAASVAAWPWVHPVKHSVKASLRAVDIGILLLVRHNWATNQLIVGAPVRGSSQADHCAARIAVTLGLAPHDHAQLLAHAGILVVGSE